MESIYGFLNNNRVKDFYKTEESGPITYLLFGGEASDILGGGGTLEKAVRAGCDARIFDPTIHSAVDLLSSYSGWDDFYVLTKKEYERVLELISER